MGVSISMKEFLKSRRDRAVGSILGWVEQELGPDVADGMTKEQWAETRRVVLGAINGYHDVVLDLMKSDDSMRNDHLVELMERVDGHLSRQDRVPASVRSMARPTGI